MSAKEDYKRVASDLSEVGTTRDLKEWADAAIAEFENRLKAAEAMSADAWRQVRIARDRAEQAEAHADAADAEHQRREDVLHEKLRQAEAENERLRAMLHVAWQRGGSAWNWPEDEWLAMLDRRRQP